MNTLYIFLAIFFVVLVTGTGLSIILLIKARHEVKRIWMKVKDE